jgi:GR25 family glycosyltransferase involved in LPS biosynthesis
VTALAGATKVYFINLDTSIARRRALEAELETCGLPFARVPGIRGDALPDSLKAYFTDAWGRQPDGMKPGEIGCFAAHLAACRTFLADVPQGVAAAVVLEDDACLSADFARAIAASLAALPPGWDLLRLSNVPKYACATVAHAAGRRIVRYSRVPTNARAYLLSPTGAEKLLRPRICDSPFDDDLRHPWRTDLHQYGLIPPLVGQRAVASDLDGFGQRVFPRPSLRQRWRRADLAGWPRRVLFQLRWLGVRHWIALALANGAERLRRRLR